jgi:hypothetical protein
MLFFKPFSNTIIHIKLHHFRNQKVSVLFGRIGWSI